MLQNYLFDIIKRATCTTVLANPDFLCLLIVCIQPVISTKQKLFDESFIQSTAENKHWGKGATLCVLHHLISLVAGKQSKF